MRKRTLKIKKGWNRMWQKKTPSKKYEPKKVKGNANFYKIRYIWIHVVYWGEGRAVLTIGGW